MLGWIARRGRYALLVGLALGVSAPGLAQELRPWITPLILFLLFLAVLRLGPSGLKSGLRKPMLAILWVLGLQLFLPLSVALLLSPTPLVLGVILMLAAPPITGSPHIAVMVGADPAPALRQLVIGTALVPLTVLPIFWALPVFGTPSDVMTAVGSLLMMIVVAGGAALALRATGAVTAANFETIDGLAAIALGAVVIGIMSAVGPALRETPGTFLLILLVAFAVNAVLQIGTFMLAENNEAAALGIGAGNRNIVLLLGVLPADLAASLLLFIGCYQVPMYLTPILYRRLYCRS